MMDKDVVSIDIGTCNIKLATGRYQGSGLTIDGCYTMPTPPHAYQDGKIYDSNNLRKAIASVLETKKIKARKAVCTVESTSIIRREIDLPVVKPEELDTMVRYEVEQYLPIMLSEYVIEYKILEEFTEDGIRKYRILVAALPKAIAEDYLELVRELKLTPVALDVNSNAVAKLLENKMYINGQSQSLDKSIALIDFGYNNTNLTIVSKGIYKFSRLINLGGNDIDINIANSFNLEMKQAESMKINEGSLESNAGDSMSDTMINDMVRFSIDNWIQEVQRLFQYYTSRVIGNTIDEIYIYGGSAKLRGLPEYVKMILNIPTYRIKSVNALKYAESIDFDYYLNAAGAIIRK